MLYFILGYVIMAGAIDFFPLWMAVPMPKTKMMQQYLLKVFLIKNSWGKRIRPNTLIVQQIGAQLKF